MAAVSIRRTVDPSQRVVYFFVLKKSLSLSDRHHSGPIKIMDVECLILDSFFVANKSPSIPPLSPRGFPSVTRGRKLSSFGMSQRR